MLKQHMLAIASYPRSGNHLVRFIVEYLTGRPTLGCLMNTDDVPIFRNTFPDDEQVLDHVGGIPVGIKAHSVAEIDRLHALFGMDALLLICRDPQESIQSNLGAQPFVFLSGSYRRKFKRHVAWYFSLTQYYRQSEIEKAMVLYENLISPEPSVYLPEIEKIAQLVKADSSAVRLETLRNDFVRLRRVNARAENRAWAGIRSGEQAVYYRRMIDPVTSALQLREIRRQARLQSA